MKEPDRPALLVPAGDHARLQALAQALAKQADPLAVLLQKLGRAHLRERDEMADDRVSLDRFVTYRIAGLDRSDRRLLIHPDDRMWPPVEISVGTPLGVTLLGLSVGDTVPLLGCGPAEPPWLEALAVDGAATSGIVVARAV